MEFHQLLPRARPVALDELMAGLQLADRAPEDRPYTISNFVSSVDGRATFGGRSGQLGDDGDRAMFHALRSQVDAVLVGTVTLRTERYRRLITDAETRQRRADAGFPREPLAIVVTRSGDVPLDIPLFDEPEAAVVIFSPVEIELHECRARVELVRLDPGEMTLVAALRHLRAEHDVRSLLCEGGPTLFGAMVREGVADELFLTLAAKLAGGGYGPTVSSGPELPEPGPLWLVWTLERASSLYLRYARSARAQGV